jgi:ribose-phosphate pyrophosphokinase
VLGASDIERIVVTDTIPPLRVTDPGLTKRLEQISAAALFAEAIRRLHNGGSIVELQGG